MGYRAPPITSWVAVAAFVCSVAGLWIVGIPLGLYGQREIDRSGGLYTGRGFATAAVVISAIELAVTIVVVVAILTSVQS